MDKHYQGILGQIILDAERHALNNYLSKIFGYHLLQLGGHPAMIAPENSPIGYKIYYNSAIFENKKCGCDAMVQGDFYALPFLADSMDLVVAPHLLEATADLKDVLDEIHRILIPEGHLIVIGFNPYSLVGIADKFKLITAFDGKANFISAGQISNWLNHLGFDIIDSQTLFFRPPIANAAILKKTLFMEIIGQMLLPKLGGVYILVAKKRVLTLTPIKHYIFNSRRLGIIEHSTKPTG